ncbi:MAG: HEAT repeat domain-containing protein, partial [Planctomycetaceae bacterium]|nr:HEAT repeat domain-containing protein [Planctomycetaceae bacterium]
MVSPAPRDAVSAQPAAAAQAAEPSLEERLPRIPLTEPGDALKTFTVAAGFKLELVAAEPLLADPVDACFDADGRMFVCEMHGYPFSEEPTRLNPNGGGKEQAGVIRMLEDTDGDGEMDRSVIFADRMSWPTSVCCYNGGLLVLAPPELYYFRDTDNDGRADVREVVLSGFSRDNVQGLTNGLKWGLDNHIWFAGGRNGADLKHRGRPLFGLRNQDLRFDPRTEKFETVSGGLQFGHSMDDWGNRFVCSNSNHILHVVYPSRYLERNPFLAVSGTVRSIAKEGGSAPVFRRSPPEPWRIVRQEQRAAKAGYKLVQGEDGTWKFEATKDAKGSPPELPTGNFTSATGVTIYRGSAWPEEFHGNAFIGDVGGNLVHRKTVTPREASFLAERADEGQEIIASSDNWFRPVNFVNAPDGSLYILDMYRETIEHPFSIPEEIKAHLRLESGDDRGRIYRLVAPGSRLLPPVKLSGVSSGELVQYLDSPNGWHRETAQRLLWERQDKSVVPALTQLATGGKLPQGRVHALWTLRGLDALTAETVGTALQDADSRVRQQAVELAEPLLQDHPELVKALVDLTDDEDQRVRFQVAFSLGESDSDQAVEGLVLLAKKADFSDLRTAILSSSAAAADRIAIRLLAEQPLSGSARSLLIELCRIAGANPQPAASLNLLGEITSGDTPLPVQQLILGSVGEG